MLWMSRLYLVLAAVVYTERAVSLSFGEQQPLINAKDDLQTVLKEAEIIPEVIDTFTPKVSLHASWDNATAKLGNTIDPSELQHNPNVVLIRTAGEETLLHDEDFVIVLTDPDAPSRADPKWSEVCHWIYHHVANVSNTGLDGDLMPYKPPGPPPKTGKHRYVFLALQAKNGTSGLNLRKPADRRNWGYEGQRVGVRKWAEEHELEVIGANFIYAQNEKQ